MPSISVRACSRVTPGLRRPMHDDAGMPVAIVGKSGGPRSERQKNIGGLEQFESRGHDANNGVRARIEIDRFADRVGCAAELALPQAVAQNRDAECAGAIFVSAKSSADVGVDAEQRRTSARSPCVRSGAGVRRRRSA